MTVYALQDVIPHLSRYALHRCQRHGIRRLPTAENTPPKKAFKPYPIGFFHIDITEVRTEKGKIYLFVAIDRTSKYVMAKLVPQANMASARSFLEERVDTVPYRIHTVLTDNGIQFVDRPQNRKGPTAMFRGHPFDRVCWQHGIEHRLTQINHPWTNGQVEG